MRIVDVCAFFTPFGGGVKTYVERKLRAGPVAGHEIVILAPGERESVEEVAPGAIMATVPAPRFPLDRRYRYFRDEAALHAALDSWNPDLVEASSPWGSASMVARWQGSAPRSLVMHSDPLAAYAYRWFGSILPRPVIDRRFDWFWRHLRQLDAQFDHVVCAGADLTERLRDGGLTKVRTVPMGVQPGVFSAEYRDEALRASLLESCGLEADATLLASVGRFAPEKRLPMLIEAVLAAGVQHPIGYLVIGEGRDRAAVIRATARSPHVRVLEPIRDRARLATVMASVDALLHGCEAETFCMVASEARASGLPLIVPDAGGASDQFVSGQGVRYRSGNGPALVEAIGSLIGDGLAPHRARAVAAAPKVRTMDEHFVDLFELYERPAGQARRLIA